MSGENKLIYLICPVANVTEDETTFLNDYVCRLERAGFNVHYPPRDVNQEDPTGLRIISEHREAMAACSEARAYWNGKSRGSYFDAGMAIMADKELRIINGLLRASFNEKAAAKILRYARKWADATPDIDPLEVLMGRREQIRREPVFKISFESSSYDSVLDFGMAFIARKPIVLMNRKDIEANLPNGKCFEKVLLELDESIR